MTALNKYARGRSLKTTANRPISPTRPSVRPSPLAASTPGLFQSQSEPLITSISTSSPGCRRRHPEPGLGRGTQPPHPHLHSSIVATDTHRTHMRQAPNKTHDKHVRGAGPHDCTHGGSPSCLGVVLPVRGLGTRPQGFSETFVGGCHTRHPCGAAQRGQRRLRGKIWGSGDVDSTCVGLVSGTPTASAPTGLVGVHSASHAEKQWEFADAIDTPAR